MKLVAEVGVGTVAAGVAKAHSDVVLISGYDGGTGASPISSLKHAGLPWELGSGRKPSRYWCKINLRDRIVVQTDGQLKTGRDVVVAALLGAEEYGFSTAPLVVMGCVMMRVCHSKYLSCGSCDTKSRADAKSLAANPNLSKTSFKYIAEEVREYMAQLGFRTVDEMVGQVDRLGCQCTQLITGKRKAAWISSNILYKPEAGPDVGIYCSKSHKTTV